MRRRDEGATTPDCRRTIIAAAAVALALAGCGSDVVDGPNVTPGDEGAILGARTVYTCRGTEVPLSVLDAGRTADTLGPDGLAALQGMEVPALDEPATWRVLEESDEALALIRPLTDADEGVRVPRSHELLTVRQLPDQELGSGWMLSAHTRCNLSREADIAAAGLTQVEVQLDPNGPDDPDDRIVGLLVTEQDCVSGQSAKGRIEVLETTSTSTEVVVLIGTEPPEGSAFNCLGNAPTPYHLEPLGDRVLLDGSIYPPRPIELPAGQ